MKEINENDNKLTFSTQRRKLKPILSTNRIKMNKEHLKSTRNKPRLIQKSFSRDNLSVLLFQSNDVDLVRNLDPYQDRNIMSNFLLKGKLKNDIIKNNEYNMQTSKRGNNDINLPKINKITANGILESENKLNQNKKEALKNLAYSQLESELCTELKKLKEKFKEKKEEKDKIYLNFKKMMDEIDEINLEIQAFNYKVTFDNLRKDADKKSEKLKKQNLIEKSADQIEKENPDNNENKKTNKDSSSNKLLMLKNMHKLKKEQDFNKKEKLDRIELLKSELSNMKEPLKLLNKELFELKNQEKEIIRKLMAHYESLLFKGEEVRSEGLIWIIKAMWSLGENVPMSFIPPFLDFHSIEFLFQYAHKSIELENTKKILNDLKNKIQIKIHKLFYASKTKGKYDSSFEFKTDLIKRNTILKSSIKEHNFVNAYINNDENEEENKNVNSIKEMTNLMEKKKNYMNLNKLEGIDKIEELKIKIKKIEDEISNLKKNEIYRLFKEFAENDYENKYHS